MSDIIVRLLVVVLAGLLAWLLVWSGRRFVGGRRRAALAAPPLLFTDGDAASTQPASVRILAFSSPGCRQCHRLQKPALQRLLDQRGAAVSVLDINAPTSPELTRRYRIFTVPATVVLDADGTAHAVNYGFANAQLLLEQVDAILSKDA